MANLMENAAHYGGGVTDIAVTLAPDERAVAVVVDDAGPGIDPAERDRIFERFYRGSAAGRRGTGTGTGLGLALVAQHMHAMNGDVRVESSPAGGARFVVTLPVIGGETYDETGESDGDGDGTCRRRSRHRRRRWRRSAAMGRTWQGGEDVRTRRASRAGALATLVLAALASAGCSIPTQGAPSAIPRVTRALRPARQAPAHDDDHPVPGCTCR